MGPDRDDDGMLIQYRGPADSPGCAQCPAAVNGAPKKPVRAFGATGGLMCVGEAPGTEEMFQGYPFVGPSGRLLTQVFTKGGIDRMLAWITNALLCPRPRDDKDIQKAVECCRPRLAEELAMVKPTAIVALGGTAARSLQLGVTTIMEARGTVQSTPLAPGLPVITTIHPAALFKGGAGEVSGGKQKANVDAQMMFLQADVEKASRVAAGKLSPIWSDDISVFPDGKGAAEAMTKILAEAREWGMLGLDMEWTKTNKITWVGLGHAGRACSFWKDALPPPALAELAAAMADEALPKLIHNSQADKGVWEGEVGPMRGEINCTMLMHHAAYPGIAHDLQQVVSQFLVVPPWKTEHKQARKASEKAAAQRDRDAKKAEKKIVHEAANAAKKAEKEAAKSQKQAEHERKNAERAAEKARKQAEKQVAHEARNTASAAEKAARKSAVPPQPVLAATCNVAYPQPQFYKALCDRPPHDERVLHEGSDAATGQRIQWRADAPAPERAQDMPARFHEAYGPAAPAPAPPAAPTVFDRPRVAFSAPLRKVQIMVIDKATGKETEVE